MKLDEKNLPVVEEVKERVKEDIFEYGLATFKRFIPSSFDGLKPVIRRTIYTCWENRIEKFTKVNKITGLVMAYHPHGDSAISEAITKMGQKVTSNHPLMDSDGNFGSISDLTPGASRYVYVRPSEFLKDVVMSLMDKHTLEMVEGEDFDQKEPNYLPTKIPLGLINGAMGIAESFTSDVPQHNLNEVADKIITYIKNKNISPYALAKNFYPDYVIGGTIINGDEIFQNYYDPEGGRGIIRFRGDAEVDTPNNRIVIRSLPLSYDFASLISKIRALMDEKDKNGNPKNLILASISYIGEAQDKPNSDPYIYITCKSGTNLVEVLENIYKYTHLEFSNKLNLTFNLNGKIKKCTLKDVIKDWYEVNYENRRRKIIHNINSLENRVHILEGLLKVYPNIDAVIAVIKKSSEGKDAIILKLKNKFGLTLIQAKGIYEMQIGNLTKRSEGELKNNISRLKDNIRNNAYDLTRIDEIMIDDLVNIKRKYGRPRRTKIISKLKERKDIVISNGAILATRNNIGIFDSTNIISGKKILNGLKSIKINNVWVKEIVSSHRIDDNIKSIIVFYENGSVNLFNPQITNGWVTNPNTDDNGFIKSVCPIYDRIEGTVVCITDGGMLKRFSMDSITTRVVNTTTVVENSIFVPNDCEDCTIMLVNDIGEYLNIRVSDIPIKGRTANGVMSGFKTGKHVRMALADKAKTHFVVLMKHTKLLQGFVYTQQIDELKIMSRTNKPKQLYKFPEFKCLGISTINLDLKDQIGLFIAENCTTSLKVTNLRNLKEPRKISCSAFDFIPITIA